MKLSSETVFVTGAAGNIECLVETPSDVPLRGIALIAHPHPLFGGANTNKVTQTLARTLSSLGYVAWRPNFRGVGQSAGTHDDGNGESDDMLCVLNEAKRQALEKNQNIDLPLVLAGFSFGAYVQARVAQSLTDAGKPPQRLVLVGTASGYVEGARHYATAAVAQNTLVIHGSADTTVPLANVLAWAEPLDIPVVVVPGAEHFFHRRLPILRDIVWRAFVPNA